MNSADQRKHRTAVTQLAADTELVITDLQAGFNTKLEALSNALAYEQKRTRQLEQEHRAYVDGADTAIRDLLDERLSALRLDMVLLIAPLQRGFWGRLRWLFTGR